MWPFKNKEFPEKDDHWVYKGHEKFIDILDCAYIQVESIKDNWVYFKRCYSVRNLCKILLLRRF